MRVMERSKSVMEKSWKNSVFKFLWEPWLCRCCIIWVPPVHCTDAVYNVSPSCALCRCNIMWVPPVHCAGALWSREYALCLSGLWQFYIIYGSLGDSSDQVYLSNGTGRKHMFRSTKVTCVSCSLFQSRWVILSVKCGCLLPYPCSRH